jgi:hypothetical protein
MSAGQARFAMVVAVAGLLGGTAELSRCRELVAFRAAAPEAIAQGRSAAFPATSPMGGDSLYQPTSFRPSQGAHGTLLKATMPTQATVPVAQSAKAAKRVLGNDAVTNPQPGFAGAFPVKNVVVKRREVHGSQPVAPESGQWVVVTTTWSSADGSRLVLTTAEVPAAMPSVRSDLPEVAAPVVPTQVYPYAAVPTRDGWLVFQL